MFRSGRPGLRQPKDRRAVAILFAGFLDRCDEITSHCPPSALRAGKHRHRRIVSIFRHVDAARPPHSRSTEKPQWIHANRASPGPTSTAVTTGFSKTSNCATMRLSLDFLRHVRVAVPHQQG
jgi:hypothetical protein